MVSLDPLVSTLKSPPHPSLPPLLPASRSLLFTSKRSPPLQRGLSQRGPSESSPEERTRPREAPLSLLLSLPSALSSPRPHRSEDPSFPSASPSSPSPKRAPLSPLRTACSAYVSTSEVRLSWTPEEKHRHEVNGHAEYDNRFEFCVTSSGISRHPRRVYRGVALLRRFWPQKKKREVALLRRAQKSI